MLNIIYFSNISENTHRFALNMQKYAEAHGEALNIQRIPITGEMMLDAEVPYILVSPSYGSERTGHVPPQVKKFLKHQSDLNLCVGVMGAGNINFGDEFAAAGHKISEHIRKPLLYCFEISGLDTDYAAIFHIMRSDALQQLIAA